MAFVHDVFFLSGTGGGTALNEDCQCNPVRKGRLQWLLKFLRGHAADAVQNVRNICRPRALSLGWNASKAKRHRTRAARGCLAGRVVELALCAQFRFRERDPVGMLSYLVAANELMPHTGSCLDDSWGVSAAEIFDNYRQTLNVLGNHLNAEEGEEGYEGGFFQKPRSPNAWGQTLHDKFGEYSEELRWRSRTDEDSLVSQFRSHAASSASPPADLKDGQTESAPCGTAPSPKDEKQSSWTSKSSTARLLSASECVWLLENACIEDRRLVLFTSQKKRNLPRRFYGCGEFGIYDFNAVEVRPLRARRSFPTNVTHADTLLIVPGMMSGVSAHNPFHVMHSTIPLAWQLHHPSYGLCINRADLDVRLAFMSGWHGRRTAHFWRAFTTGSRVDAGSLDQRYSIASSWRFWWGPLTDYPPLPLGTGEAPRCYRKVIFGRELLRTGLGGFVTPRVLAFSRHYWRLAISADDGGNPRQSDRPVQLSMKMERGLEAVAPDSNALAEWKRLEDWETFEDLQPRPDAENGRFRRGLLGLLMGGVHGFFPVDGGSLDLLKRFPMRMWNAAFDAPAALSAISESAIQRSEGNMVETKLVQSRGFKVGDSPPRQINVVLVQRAKKAGRWIANLAEVEQWVQDFAHPHVRIAMVITDFEFLHPAAQWQLASQTDILIGVTGAAVAWLAFQPPGSAVLDIFPPNSNFCSEGWGKNTVSHYGGLARLAGVHHTCMIHPVAFQSATKPGETIGQQTRREVKELLGGYWHGQNVKLDMAKFAHFFREAVTLVPKQESPPQRE